MDAVGRTQGLTMIMLVLCGEGVI